MRLSIFIWVILLLSCQRINPISNERLEAAYISENGLPYDGCEEHVRLTTADASGNVIRYKPTAATLPLYQKALNEIPAAANSSEKAVNVRFTETGRQVDLLCGREKRFPIAEIEILEITPR